MAKIEESISEDGQKIEITKNIKAEQRRYGSDKGISSRVEGVFGSQFPIDENVEVDLGVLQKILKLYLSARMATHCVILLAAIVNMFDAVSDYSLVYYLSATGFRYAGLIILLIDYGIFFITLVHYNMMFHQTEKRLKLIFISVFLTIFQPFTPAISALSWYIARSQRLKQETQDKLHYLTKTTTTIQGCAEAPAQIVASSWMVLTDQLEVPWKESSLICDNLGNCLHLGLVIPLSSIIISWISLVKASLDAFQTTDIISTVGLLFPNLLFRLGCSILLVTFLQFWSMGVFIMLFLVNITITCCYSANQKKKQGVFKTGINLFTTMLVSIFTFNMLPADPTAKERKGKADVDTKHVKKLATAIVTGGSTVMLLAMCTVYGLLETNFKTDFNIILTMKQFEYSFFVILLPLYFVSLMGTLAFFFTFNNNELSTFRKLAINGIPLIMTIGTILWSIYNFPLGTNKIHIAVQTQFGDLKETEIFTGVTGGALFRNYDQHNVLECGEFDQSFLKCGDFKIDLKEKDSRTLNFTKKKTIFLLSPNNPIMKKNIKKLEEKIYEKVYKKVFLIKSPSTLKNQVNICLKCNNPADNFCKRKVHEASIKLCSDSVIHGNWSTWNSSPCSATCGEGMKRLIRHCNNPVPMHGGQDCIGDKTKLQTCKIKECPIDGGWSEWVISSKCSMKCGVQGKQELSRTCSNPPPLYGGQNCQGNSKSTKNCSSNIANCSSILFESLGGAAEYQGPQLGVYEELPQKFNGKPVFHQKGGLNFIYHNLKSGKWYVGEGLGKIGFLAIQSDSPTPPTTGWFYAKSGQWVNDDDSLKLTYNPEDTLCEKVIVSSSGAAGTIYSEMMGEFTWNKKTWMNGRKLLSNGVNYIRVPTGSMSWLIGPEIDSTVGMVQSGRGTVCPSLEESGPSIRFAWDWWQYYDSADEEWKPDVNITVKCVVQSLLNDVGLLAKSDEKPPPAKSDEKPPGSILFESLGGAAEYFGRLLGFYDELPQNINRKPAFQLRGGSTFIYHQGKSGNWAASRKLGATTDVSFYVVSNSSTPPTSGWYYWKDVKWVNDDNSLKLTYNPEDILCDKVIVSSSGAAGTIYSDKMGEFTWNKKTWMNGRKLLSNGGNYLTIRTGYTGWSIGREIDSNRFWISSGRGTMCPCLEESGPSIRSGWDWWQYYDSANKEWKRDVNITVKCAVLSLINDVGLDVKSDEKLPLAKSDEEYRLAKLDDNPRLAKSDKKKAGSILYESLGGAANHQGQHLGFYEELPQKINRRPTFQQRGGTTFIYHNAEYGKWFVGKKLGSITGIFFLILSNSPTPPTSGWFYFNGVDFVNDDDSLKLTYNPEDIKCDKVIYSSSGAAGTIQSDSMGEFTWYNKTWLNGRKLLSNGVNYLRVPTGMAEWTIGAKIDTDKSWIRSGGGTVCPCLEESGPSIRLGIYWDSKEWKPDNFTVKCV